MCTYYAFRIAASTLAYFPRKIGYLIVTLIADILYLASPGLRNAVADNMRHVLGSEADEAAVKRAARGVLRNAAKNYFDLIKIPCMKLEEVESCISVHGWNNLQNAMEKGKGVTLVTAHQGSFDIAAQIFAVRSIKTTVLVESLEPPSLLKHVTALRSRNGVAFTPGGLGILKVLTQSLRRGEAVLMACDRDIANNGSEADFFGRKTILPATAVQLAMRTGAALVPVFNLRRENGQYDVFFEPAIDIILRGNGAAAKNMGNVARIMEKYIRRCPEQWVVLRHFWPKGHSVSTDI